MAKTSAIPGWQLALLILTGTVVGVVVVTCLYWARTVFIPVVLAVFLTFLLAPLVSALQRRGLRRLFSVILVVMLAGALLGGVVWLVTAQVTSLAGEVPKYTENVKSKVKSLRHLGQGSVTSGLAKLRICATHGRPVLCTEWLVRRGGKTFEQLLPLFRDRKIGCWDWGFVAGRTQTYFPWGSPPNAPEPKQWQHDILRADGAPFSAREVQFNVG